MPDVWATVAELDSETQERLADVLETRGSEAAAGDAARSSPTSISGRGPRRGGRRGTGVLTRMLAGWENVGSVVGVDVAPSLLERARRLAESIENTSFEQADARALPFADEAFDVAVFDSTLTHVPEPQRALAEAFRVLRPRGSLAVFDGDYATTTVAIGDDDPLQTCVEAMVAHSVTDRWLARRLPALVRACSFDVSSFRSHGFVETTDATSCSRSSIEASTSSARRAGSATTQRRRSGTRPGAGSNAAASSGTSRT